MRSSEGRYKAIVHTPKFSDIALEYRKLNTREARVAFVDTFLKTWASRFEDSWPVIYQALEWVEQDKLYQDPRVMEPGEVYPDFKSYFEARLKKPFTLWIEMEQTHRYVTKFAPDLIQKAWPEARDRALGKNRGGQPGNKNAAKNEADNISIVSKPREYGTSRAYILARLDRDGHTELAAKVRAKTMSADAAAKSVSYRKQPTPLDQLRKFWLKATEEERATFLAEVQS